MILCPEDTADMAAADIVSSLCTECGFGRITISSAEEHDRIIAYTSQLAHIVSGAYINSETAGRHSGFSAGSFRDMTRVATLNAPMWTELMLQNSDNLKIELDALISRLCEFSHMLERKDKDGLFALLREGGEKKAQYTRYEKP